MKDNRVKIRNELGEIHDALAPVIISASRATDIPAFYAKWFFNRLEKGYCAWINPFNHKKSYISFKKCKVVVFWTKNPGPIIPYLKELDKRGIHYYFQVTLNDYVNEMLEPNLPTLGERIESFRRLSEKIGPDRVIWRFDPLIMTSNLTVEKLLRKIKDVGNRLKGATHKLVFSFVDIANYRNVKANLAKTLTCVSESCISQAELDSNARREIVKGLLSLQNSWAKEGWNVDLATCGEQESFPGVEHNRCIDGELMSKLFKDDIALLRYLSTGKLSEPDLFSSYCESFMFDAKRWKDKGQRKECGCMVSKDIGAYSTCRHFCAYCYANKGRGCVLKNLERFDENSEALC